MTEVLTQGGAFDTIIRAIPCSSMVEQEAVNFEVVSSSLTGGAIFYLKKSHEASFLLSREKCSW